MTAKLAKHLIEGKKSVDGIRRRTRPAALEQLKPSPHCGWPRVLKHAGPKLVDIARKYRSRQAPLLSM
jgi:hypothetical protein